MSPLGWWLVISNSSPDALGRGSSPLLGEEHPSGQSCPQSPFYLPLQTNTGIRRNLEQEVIHYSFQSSFFDIFVSDLRPPESSAELLYLGSPPPHS